MRERILLLRKELKISQTKFAEDLNLSRTFINLYENGNRELSDRTISDICRIYNVNETWIRTGNGNMFNPLSKEAEVAEIAKRVLQAEPDDFLANIIKNLSKLDVEEWKELNKIIKKLIKDEKDSSND